MNRKIISASAIALMAFTSPAVTASAQTPAAPAKETSVSFSKSAGPTVEATKVGVKQAQNTSKAPVAYDAHVGAGRNVALMVVGGAALIIGAVIGGAPGVIIAVAGAAVGLYGLYYFIQ